MRNRAIAGGMALILGSFLASSGVQAQCVDNIPPIGATAQFFYPFLQGGSVNAMVSVLNTANTAFLTGTTAFVGSPPSPQADQQGGGVWARAIGGTVETGATGTTDVSLTIPVLGGTVAASNVLTCDTTTRQDFAGIQVGQDIAKLNLDGNGGNIHFGVTAGYFEADAKDITPGGGTFSGDFQAPFVGIYAALTKGNLFADGQIRWDFFNNKVSDPANGLFDQTFNAENFAVAGNVGYRFDLASKWFIEPSLGGVWSRAEVDALNMTGTALLGQGSLSLPGTVQIDDVETRLFRASLRVGTSFVSGNIALQPFATASVFREYGSDVTTTISADVDSLCAGAGLLPNCLGLGLGAGGTASMTTDRVGTYGQFGLGITGQIINTGWNGYARVDYRTGENIEGVSGNLGLRYQFTPGSVTGASLKDGPLPSALHAYNWTGFYIGGFAGRTEGDENWVVLPPGAPGLTLEPSFAGYLLGGQAGYNYQVASWVFGVEGDIGGSNAEGAVSCPTKFFFTCEAEIDRLATVTGRLGYSWERALLYVKGGLAVGEVTAATSFNPQGPSFIPLPPGVSPTVDTATHTLTGWTVGGGMEFALAQNWSAKGEYMYYDLGSEIFVQNPSTIEDVATTGNIVRVGVNYHFNQ